MTENVYKFNKTGLYNKPLFERKEANSRDAALHLYARKVKPVYVINQIFRHLFFKKKCITLVILLCFNNISNQRNMKAIKELP